MLENRVRQYTSPYCDVIRAKIVLLAAEGLSNDVIATRLDTPRQIVSKWRKRFALARLPGLEAQPRSGRPTRCDLRYNCRRWAVRSARGMRRAERTTHPMRLPRG